MKIFRLAVAIVSVVSAGMVAVWLWPSARTDARLVAIADEGSLTRPSPEQRFIETAARAPPKAVAPATADPRQEARRTFGALRELFARMKRLAYDYKKSDPTKYAKLMAELQGELASLMGASKAQLAGSDVAVKELFEMVRDEQDPVLKERMTYLARFAGAERAGPLMVSLSESPNADDRKAAIDTLGVLRTEGSASALLKRAAEDSNLEVRQRAIVAMGKMVSRPSASSDSYEASTYGALRQYTQASNDPQIREAAWGALSYLPNVSAEDHARIQTALHTEKDPRVLREVENAWRRANIAMHQGMSGRDVAAR